MNPDHFIFPAPKFSAADFEYESIIWIPKKFGHTKEPEPDFSSSFFSFSKASKPKPKEYIPCLYIPYQEGSNKFMIFFHGNGEDIVITTDFCLILSDILRINVIGMEYPGYSIYPGNPESNRILEDSLILYDYLTQKVKIQPQDIIVFGRSIGSGPATYLAARREISALFLMSPYTSIKDIAKRVAGSFAASLLRNRFKNIDEIRHVTAPVLFVHGQKDHLIPHTHSMELSKLVSGSFETNFPEFMTHNDFKMEADLIEPILNFIKKYNIKIKTGEPDYKFDPKVFKKRDVPISKEKQRPFWVRMIQKIF